MVSDPSGGLSRESEPLCCRIQPGSTGKPRVQRPPIHHPSLLPLRDLYKALKHTLARLPLLLLQPLKDVLTSFCAINILLLSSFSFLLLVLVSAFLTLFTSANTTTHALSHFPPPAVVLANDNRWQPTAQIVDTTLKPPPFPFVLHPLSIKTFRPDHRIDVNLSIWASTPAPPRSHTACRSPRGEPRSP